MAPCYSAAEGELPRLRYSYKDEWAWSRLPLWAVGCLAIAAMATVLTVGALLVVAKSQLEEQGLAAASGPHDEEGDGLLARGY
jgi:hypothetical protein